MYRSVGQLDSLSQLLASWFPGYFMRFALPEPSVQGRAVYALRLRAGGGGERRGVMVVGGTHSRELMNPDAIIELAVDLFVSHVTGSDITYGNRTWSAAEIKLILETLDLSHAERRQRLGELLAELNLTALAKAPAYTLSGGERRRAEITRALVISPRFILLDEPFAGIDPIAVTDIQKIIFHLKERGIGVLITDHNVRETLRITDRAYIVTDGVIFRSGTPDQLAADEDVRRIYLGTDFRLD